MEDMDCIGNKVSGEDRNIEIRKIKSGLLCYLCQNYGDKHPFATDFDVFVIPVKLISEEEQVIFCEGHFKSKDIMRHSTINDKGEVMTVVKVINPQARMVMEIPAFRQNNLITDFKIFKKTYSSRLNIDLHWEVLKEDGIKFVSKLNQITIQVNTELQIVVDGKESLCFNEAVQKYLSSDGKIQYWSRMRGLMKFCESPFPELVVKNPSTGIEKENSDSELVDNLIILDSKVINSIDDLMALSREFNGWIVEKASEDIVSIHKGIGIDKFSNAPVVTKAINIDKSLRITSYSNSKKVGGFDVSPLTIGFIKSALIMLDAGAKVYQNIFKKPEITEKQTSNSQITVVGDISISSDEDSDRALDQDTEDQLRRLLIDAKKATASASPSKTPKPNFTCKICSKKYILSSFYIRHLKTHESVPKSVSTKIRCPICSQEINTKFNQFHIKAKHSNARYNCVKCNEKFNDWESLKDHFQKSHPKYEFKEAINYITNRPPVEKKA